MTELSEHVKRVVDEWPPLRPEQIDRIAVLLYGGRPHSAPTGPSPAMLEQQRRDAEAEAERNRVRKLAEQLTACDMCDVPLDKHRFAEMSSEIEAHEWVPGRANAILGSKK